MDFILNTFKLSFFLQTSQYLQAIFIEFVTISCLVHAATSMALCIWWITLSLDTQNSILLSLSPFLGCHCCGNFSLPFHTSIFFTLTYLLSEQEALAMWPETIYWKEQLFGVFLSGFSHIFLHNLLHAKEKLKKFTQWKLDSSGERLCRYPQSLTG